MSQHPMRQPPQFLRMWLPALGKLTLDAMREGFVEAREEDDLDDVGAFG